MATRRFEKTVSALVYAIVSERCPRQLLRERGSENEVVRFVLAQHARMPDYLRLPIRMATAGLALWARAVTWRSFQDLPPERRWKVAESWRNARLGPCRDLIKFYESLAVFACYSIAGESSAGEDRAG